MVVSVRASAGAGAGGDARVDVDVGLAIVVIKGCECSRRISQNVMAPKESSEQWRGRRDM